MPFSALKGYEEKTSEEGRMVSQRRILDEDKKIHLDYTLSEILHKQLKHVSIIYFKEDKLKSGGEYIKVEGYINKITNDFINVNNTIININDIYEIEVLK